MRRLNKTWPYEKQLKNRSSKQNSWFVGVGRKSIVRCVSNALLEKWAGTEVPGAVAEVARRQKRAEKKSLKSGN